MMCWQGLFRCLHVFMDVSRLVPKFSDALAWIWSCIPPPRPLRKTDYLLQSSTFSRFNSDPQKVFIGCHLANVRPRNMVRTERSPHTVVYRRTQFQNSLSWLQHLQANTVSSNFHAVGGPGGLGFQRYRIRNLHATTGNFPCTANSRFALGICVQYNLCSCLNVRFSKYLSITFHQRHYDI